MNFTFLINNSHKESCCNIRIHGSFITHFESVDNKAKFDIIL
jgi:hypothetical protein